MKASYNDLIYLLSTLVIVAIGLGTHVSAQSTNDSALWQTIIQNDLYYKCSEDIAGISSPERRAIEYSRIGADRHAYRSYDFAYDKPMIESSDQYYVVGGVDNVLSAIEESAPRLVALNEGHHQSHHRIVASAFLKDLYRMGFRHIAIEGLDKIDTSLNERGYAKYLLSGLYISDPEYANFLRLAMRYGFELIAYDQIGSADREYAGAMHLCDYMAKESIDRLFVYCGYDHVRERPGTIIDHLSTFLDTDPYTISQTEYHGAPFRYDPSICDDTYALFSRGDHDFYHGQDGDVDACIFSNREVVARRKYLSSLYDSYIKYSPLKRPYLNHNIDYPIQIRAMVASEGRLGIPVDIIEIKDRYHLKDIFLNLLTGYSYDINFYDRNGALVKTNKVTVPYR